MRAELVFKVFEGNFPVDNGVHPLIEQRDVFVGEIAFVFQERFHLNKKFPIKFRKTNSK